MATVEKSLRDWNSNSKVVAVTRAGWCGLYLASGMTEAEVIEDFSEPTPEEVRVCLAFAADRERHTRLMGS